MYFEHCTKFGDGMFLAARNTPSIRAITMVVYCILGRVQNVWAPEGSTPGLLEGIFLRRTLRQGQPCMTPCIDVYG